MKRSRTARARDGKAAADGLRERLLEAPHEAAGRGDPVLADAFGHVRQLIAVEQRLGDRDQVAELLELRLGESGGLGGRATDGRGSGGAGGSSGGRRIGAQIQSRSRRVLLSVSAYVSGAAGVK